MRIKINVSFLMSLFPPLSCSTSPDTTSDASSSSSAQRHESKTQVCPHASKQKWLHCWTNSVSMLCPQVQAFSLNCCYHLNIIVSLPNSFLNMRPSQRTPPLTSCHIYLCITRRIQIFTSLRGIGWTRSAEQSNSRTNSRTTAVSRPLEVGILHQCQVLY